VKNNVAGLDEVIPVLDDQVLPVWGAVAVLLDIGMEEMGVRNNPGRIAERISTFFQICNLLAGVGIQKSLLSGINRAARRGH